MKMNRRDKVISWLDGESEFYSKIMEEPTKRSTALLVNLIAICVSVMAIAADGALIISFIATLCAGYLVRRLNKGDE